MVMCSNHNQGGEEVLNMDQYEFIRTAHRLGVQSKYFIDTIKLVAYRAETAMVNSIRQTMRRTNEARRLLKSLYAAEADLVPDYEKNKLTVRLHQPATHCSAATMNYLCQELNATRTEFPGTNLRLVYELVS